ncbi:MAG: hypothetical protein ACRD4X_17605 [Candidatus Acidiferrales bacterium]
MRKMRTWRSGFKSSRMPETRAADLSDSTRDLILRYSSVLNAYEGAQKILGTAYHPLLIEDFDDKMDSYIREAVIPLSQVPEPAAAALGRVVCQMWTDAKYCWTKDHEVSRQLSRIADEVRQMKAHAARQRAERLYAQPKPDLETFILLVREWDETGRSNKKLLAQILELQQALGIKPSPGAGQRSRS